MKHTPLAVIWLASVVAAAALSPQELVPRVPIENDRELFEAFALDQPNLAAVKAAVNTKDFPVAKSALLAHFRQRRSPMWFLNWWEKPAQQTNAPPAALLQAAEAILAHQFKSASASVRFEGPIDWQYLPSKLPDGMPDYQVPLVLYINRFTWWRDILGPAYWATSDEQCAREWAAQARDWTARNPAASVFNERATPSPWRRLTAAYSIPMWIYGLNYFLQSPSVTPDTLAAFFKALVQKVRFTIRNPDEVNRRLVQLEAVHAVATCFPELRDAARWRQWALDETDRFIADEIYPDGALKELAPGYQSVAIASLRNMIALASANGAPLRYTVRDALARATEYLAGIALPDGTVPAFGDTWAPAYVAPELLRTLPFYPPEKGERRREQLRYIITLGGEGEPPPLASTAAPWAGIYVMHAQGRTNVTAHAYNERIPPGAGWHRTDLALAFRAGPFGTEHQHEDKLSFVLYGFGSHMLDEMGVYSNSPGFWRDYFASTTTHNTLLVDGLGQNRRARAASWVAKQPLEGNWITNDVFDFVSGVYDDGWGPQSMRSVTQRREIFFAKPDYWIVHDVLSGSGEHTYEALFHWLPPNNVEIHDQTKVCFSANANRPNLAIYPVDSDVEVELLRGWQRAPHDPLSPRQAWFSPGFQKIDPAPCTVIRRRGPAPQVIENILLPALPRDTPDIAAQRLVVTDTDNRVLRRTEVCALRIFTRAGVHLYVNDLRAESVTGTRPLPKRISAGRFGTIEFSGKLLFIQLNTLEQPLLVRHTGVTSPTRAGREIEPIKH
ncbi:MAG: alginate lyase family protein [Verrucomicrobia bacterium]|nr:alginate lyase family protein [Verrucomicrobiota bacterium]